MGYVAYPEYRDSHDRWLGKIPTHWKTKPLKFAAKVQPSNVDKITEDGELPVQLCNYVDVYKNEAITDGLSFMQATATVEEIAKFRVEAGDVIVTKDSETAEDIAVPAYVPKPLDNVVCGYHLTQIKPELVEGSYLFRLFQSSAFNKQFVVGANGVTRFGLPQQVINDATICIPEPGEQQAIARFLDHKTAQIDALIAKKQALLQKLAEKRTALISHAVTKGLDPFAPMKDSGVDWLGPIPKHWDVKRLRFLVQMSGGMTPSTANSEYWNGDVPWVTPKDMKVEDISDSIDKLTQEALAKTAIQINDTGCVLIVVRGMILAHSFPVAINMLPVTINQDMKALSTSLDPCYLAILLRGIKNLILSVVEEAAHGTKVMRTDLFKNIHLPVPPLSEQEKVVTEVNRVVSEADRMSSHVASAIARLNEYRSALITAAVTGKIDVRDVPIPEAA